MGKFKTIEAAWDYCEKFGKLRKEYRDKYKADMENHLLGGYPKKAPVLYQPHYPPYWDEATEMLNNYWALKTFREDYKRAQQKPASLLDLLKKA